MRFGSVRQEPARLFSVALATSLAISALLYFFWSWRWPLVGDASLMHYIGFLVQRGWAPYRELGDMNMPGSYLIEIAAMHLFGTGDLAWRLFDFTLLAIASASFFIICVDATIRVPHVRKATVGLLSGLAQSPSFLPALFSASLFILIHGRDGLAEGGQRDLIMGICLLAATAFLLLAIRKDTVWPAALFGLLSGAAMTIKPTTLPLTLLQLAIAIAAVRQSDRNPQARNPASPWLRYALLAALAYLVAPAIALIFLLRESALPAFLSGFRGIIPYYASLGHRPLSFILLHSISPLLPLMIVWIVILALDRPRLDLTRALLAAGVLYGFANCILQARALPYYRYPLLAFLLPLMALDFTAAAQAPRRVTKALAVLALAFAGFFLAPQSAVLIHRYRWREIDFIASLEKNLNALGGPALSRHIQCIDTNSGCGNVLYRMRLEPANGMLSDFLLFGQPSQDVGTIIFIHKTRDTFLADLRANPPRVLVVTSNLYLSDLEPYRKLDQWPAFTGILADRYRLATEWSPTRTARWWSREETPASYRIYVLRTNAVGAPRSQSDRGVGPY